MDIVQPAGSELWFSSGLFHEGGTVVSAPQPLLPVDSWIAGTYQAQVQDRGAEREKKAAKESEDYEELVIAMPWLSVLDDKIGFGSSDDGAKKRRLDQEEDPTDDLEAPDISALEVLAELDKARALYAPPPAVDVEHFGWRIRGGESQVRATGEAVHAIQGQAFSPEAVSFSDRRKLQVTFKATFSIDEQEDSATLVRAWVHKMNYFLALELHAPEGTDLVFSAAQISAYQPPTDFESLAARAKGRLLGRVNFVQKLPAPNKR